jgi:hypothetical protein
VSGEAKAVVKALLAPKAANLLLTTSYGLLTSYHLLLTTYHLLPRQPSGPRHRSSSPCLGSRVRGEHSNPSPNSSPGPSPSPSPSPNLTLTLTLILTTDPNPDR